MWVKKKSHADNHYLDTEVYAMAAADTLGVRTLHLMEQGQAPPPTEEKTEEPEESWIRENEWLGGEDGQQ